MTTVSIIGGSGYGGGELLRLLLGHPNVEVKQVTSRSHLGEYVYQVHPNLRKRTQLKFSDPAVMEPVDVLFLAQPHGQAQHHIEEYAMLAPKIIDLAADFRLRDTALYEQWYGEKHAAPAWLDKFVYGLPELHRAEMATANYVSGVGCNATASNLALLPLIKAILRRTAAPSLEEKIVRHGLLSIDAERHRVTVRDAEITLTLTEFKLLTILAGRPGRMQSRERLLQDVWGYSSDADTRTVDTHITRLRSKLGEAGEMIRTVRGYGYKLEPL